MQFKLRAIACVFSLTMISLNSWADQSRHLKQCAQGKVAFDGIKQLMIAVSNSKSVARIAIVPALLKAPKILIFDEATSSLDASTAEHFAATINQLKGKVTMPFIAHGIPKNLQIDEIVRMGASTLSGIVPVRGATWVQVSMVGSVVATHNVLSDTKTTIRE